MFLKPVVSEDLGTDSTMQTIKRAGTLGILSMQFPLYPELLSHARHDRLSIELSHGYRRPDRAANRGPFHPVLSED